MKSSKEIPPRIGMQVRFIGESKKVIALASFGVDFDDWSFSPVGFWNDGHYEIEWIPPTDEERKAMNEGARLLRSSEIWSAIDDKWSVFAWCEPALHADIRYENSHQRSFEIAAQILESLAMDGM